MCKAFPRTTPGYPGQQQSSENSFLDAELHIFVDLVTPGVSRKLKYFGVYVVDEKQSFDRTRSDQSYLGQSVF
jgi:hypothetical protein